MISRRVAGRIHKPKGKTKMSKKNDPSIWGSAGYLKATFADITTAVKCAEDSVEFGVIDERVKAIRTNKNGAYTYSVFRTKGKRDVTPVKYIVGHIALGLNGPGKQVDYLAAMQKLLKDGKLTILDAHLDVIDDLWDFLVITESTERP